MITNKMRRKYHDMAATIRDLEERLARAESDKAQAVREASLALEGEVRSLRIKIDGSRTQNRRLTEMVAEMGATVAHLTLDLRAARAQVTAIQPTLDALDRAWSEISEIVDQVRGRMRRREAEMVAAIVNRRALARALLMSDQPDDSRLSRDAAGE